jgi:hypothetical protein
VHPPAALLHADRAPLVLYKRTEEKSPQNPDIRQPKQQEENAIYRNEGETAGVYLGEEAVLGEELGDLGREDDVSARKKGDPVRVLPTTAEERDGERRKS